MYLWGSRARRQDRFHPLRRSAPPPSISFPYPRWKAGDPFPRQQDDDENSLWVELLHPFAAVKYLYPSEKIVPHIALALQEPVKGKTTEVLPTLDNIFLKPLERLSLRA